jgi:hypothetical protein
MRADTVVVEGTALRFCQKCVRRSAGLVAPGPKRAGADALARRCNRLQALSDFDNGKHTCTARLVAQNARRRVASAARAAARKAEWASSAAAAATQHADAGSAAAAAAAPAPQALAALPEAAQAQQQREQGSTEEAYADAADATHETHLAVVVDVAPLIAPACEPPAAAPRQHAPLVLGPHTPTGSDGGGGAGEAAAAAAPPPPSASSANFGAATAAS